VRQTALAAVLRNQDVSARLLRFLTRLSADKPTSAQKDNLTLALEALKANPDEYPLSASVIDSFESAIENPQKADITLNIPEGYYNAHCALFRSHIDPDDQVSEVHDLLDLLTTPTPAVSCESS